MFEYFTHHETYHIYHDRHPTMTLLASWGKIHRIHFMDKEIPFSVCLLQASSRDIVLNIINKKVINT